MDAGGSSYGGGALGRRAGSKRPFSTMAEAHRSESPLPSLFTDANNLHDHLYNNTEHTAQRRRLHLPTPVRTRFPGDGVDFRRPTMSNVNPNPAVIDLTDEDGSEESPEPPQQEVSGQQDMAPAAVVASSSRASRLPRFDRDIIDLDASPTESQRAGDDEEQRDWRTAGLATQPTADNSGTNGFRTRGGADMQDRYNPPPPLNTRPTTSILRRPSRFDVTSDDVEIVSARATSGSRSRHDTPVEAARRQRARVGVWHPPNDATPAVINLTDDTDHSEDEVVHINTRAREDINAEHPTQTAGVGTRSIADRAGMGGILRMLQQGENGIGPVPRLMDRLGLTGMQEDFEIVDGGPEVGYHHLHIHRHTYRAQDAAHGHEYPLLNGRPAPRVDLPAINMNYGTVAFDMGLHEHVRPATPKYSPPLEPGLGFTRTPAVDEILVCPNCGDELGMGDDEIKRSVWVVKGCGHTYCGNCTQHRSRTHRKTKAPAHWDNMPIPFKKCLVEGCGKTTQKNSMVKVNGIGF